MGHFLEHLLGEVATSDALVEFHELHDVAHGRNAGRVSEATTVAIESLHRPEVGATDADNDDGAGHLGELTDQVDSLRHVMDGAIGQQKKDLVLILIHC